MAKNTYKVEIWQYHKVIDEFTTTNKQKAKNWIKDNGYTIQSDNGQCFIHIICNDKPIDSIEERNWPIFS